MWGKKNINNSSYTTKASGIRTIVRLGWSPLSRPFRVIFKIEKLIWI